MKRSRTVRSLLDAMGGEALEDSVDYQSEVMSLSSQARSRTTSTTPESDIAFMNDIYRYFENKDQTVQTSTIPEEEEEDSFGLLGMFFEVLNDEGEESRDEDYETPSKTRKLSHINSDQRSSEVTFRFTMNEKNCTTTCPTCSVDLLSLSTHLCSPTKSQDEISSLTSHFITLFCASTPSGNSHLSLV